MINYLTLCYKCNRIIGLAKRPKEDIAETHMVQRFVTHSEYERHAYQHDKKKVISRLRRITIG